MGKKEIIIPPLFKCPISLDLFQDPVTLSTGQTYDRPFIQKWLSDGNSTCPITMQNLQDTSMVPNHTLRHLIHQWLHSHSNTTPDFITIKRIVESENSTLEDNLKVIEAIHSLSQELPLATCLFETLLQLILKNGQSLMVVEKALDCALTLMPFTQMGPFSILKQEDNYARFLRLFTQGNVQIKKSLCLVVEFISSSQETKHLCEEKLVEIIVGIIHHDQAGIRAALALSFNESSRSCFVRHGAVEVLIHYLSDCGEVENRAMAMSTIENLLSESGAKDAILKHAFGVKAIVKMVFRVSEHQGSESAVNSLLIVCSESKNGREMAILEGVLTQLLLLLQSQCNATTKTKARQLLNLLRD